MNLLVRLQPTVLVLACLAGTLLQACEPAASVGPRAVFAGPGASGVPNALGETVALRQFAGKFVWIDYAAEWCSSCVPQSQAIRSLADAAPDDLVFITIMTSEIGGYGHPATPETAARWAQRLSLNPSRVLAADDTARTLPQHALYSPDGTEVFRHVGRMSAADIRRAIAAAR